VSIQRLVSLDAFCDQCHRAFGEADDEPATAPGVGSWTSDMPTARRDMATYGWTRTWRHGRVMDLCPKCQSDETVKKER
jgi:hypothetical protein